MSIERELLQTALGILEDYEWGYGGDHHKSPEASILNDIRKLLAQPEQEPVAWMVETHFNNEPIKEFHMVKPMERVYKYCKVTELYTAPQNREPLSDEEITKLWANQAPQNEFACVRLIEKAHGIGGGDDESTT